MSIKHFLAFDRAEFEATTHEAGAFRSRRRGDRSSQRFDEAMTLMEDGRWQQAFARLAELADAGHPQAARIAMLYVQRGTSLFGGHFSASARQREFWQRASD